ncbi:MAG: 1-deoxy-D-xylulose-5-phosphate reductoisomerase [Rhodospirillaceae bacterium]|nr:1-deoxy-D-xylulose-5-phosphate reductoisomerase [Rhodospirillaceae bacterium]
MSRDKRIDEAPKRVTVLGATGSVGSSALDLLARDRGAFAVEVLTAYDRVDALIAAARALSPSVAVIGRPELYSTLKEGLEGTGVEAAAGKDALIEAASRPVDWAIGGIVGAAGLEPTLAAARHARVLALANKECLVCAGDIFKAEIARYGTTLIPVDSEHSAIFQALAGENPTRVERLILTASGGPFNTLTRAEMADVSPQQAVKHPRWHMGAKISVDSATMMNKGLEVIEAFHLFAMPEDRIEVVIHPQSVIHSMVEFCDGAILAQMGAPDMRTPIAVSLAWPDRMATPVKRLDFATLGALTFAMPDERKFPCLRLAREALRHGGAFPTLLNAANEVVVQAFLRREIGFLDISEIVETVLGGSSFPSPNSLEDVLIVDAHARMAAAEAIRALGRIFVAQSVVAKTRMI